MSNANPDFSARDAALGVSELFVTRWSPRAYLPAPVSEQDMQTIFDAARWSPSCYNEQPWLFLTSTEATREQFLDLLVEPNQRWAKNAPVIGFVIADRHFARNGEENAHAVFDAGAAWMAINLQAAALGLHVHGMAGIHYEEAYRQLRIDPQTRQVVCGFTLGRLDASGDEAITSRKPLHDIWHSGLLDAE